MLRLSCPQISITVNVKCHCQWNPANQLIRTTGNIGICWCKSSSEVWFGPGLSHNFIIISWWCHYVGDKSDIFSAQNRAFNIVCWRHESHIHISVNRLLFLHDSCDFFVLFTSIVQKLQALNQYTLNKVLRSAGSRCRIFILQHCSFDHCISQTRHTSALFNNEYPMSVTQLISGGLQKDWLSIGYKVKLHVEILLI